MPKKNFNVTLLSGNHPKRMAKISLNMKDGTVFIVPARLDVLAFGSVRGLQRCQISQLKTSVHSSPNSPSHNIIKTTVELNGEPESFVMASQAMKTFDRFQHIYTYRLSDLKSDRHDFAGSAELRVNCNLLEYTPFCHYCVSRASRDFSDAFKTRWDCYSVVIGDFRVHLIFNYLSICPIGTQERMGNASIKPETECGRRLVFDEGHGEQDIEKFLLAYQHALAHTFIQEIASDFGDKIAASTILHEILELGFVSRARDDSIYGDNLQKRDKLASLFQRMIDISK